MKPVISILLVTYQSQDDIKACLDSIKQFCHISHEILILDTGSTDQTEKIVKSHSLFKSKKLHYRISKKNLGYAGGQQLLSTYAKGSYLLFLNPDARLTSKCLEPMIKAFQENKNLFAVQPAVYLLCDNNTLNLTGKVTHYLGFDYLRDYKAHTLRKSAKIGSVSGSAFLCSTQKFKKIRGFNSVFFMYYEDSDLSWRARLAGYDIWFENKSVFFHDYKFIPNEVQQSYKNKLFYNERNRLMMIFNNYQVKTLLLLLPSLFVVEIMLLVYSLLSGWLDKKLQSYMQLISLRKEIENNRDVVAKLRKIDDAEVTAIFTARINFAHFDHPIVRYILNPFLWCYWKIVRVFI